MPHRFAAALASAALLLGAAGCGLRPAAGRPPETPLAMAQCMRSHGVPDFPDASGGGFNTVGTPSATTVNGVTLQESAAQVQSAQAACQPDAGSPLSGAPNPQLEKEADAYAACMRTHGVANFPDPQVGSHGVREAVPAGTDPNSPQFQTAQAACQSLLPGAGS